MKIYGSKAGGNPVRVAFFLAEKGIDVEFISVDLLKGEHREREFVSKNPFMQIPVLELDDGTVISETVAICRYFERLYPEPNLMGKDPLEEAVIEMWQRRVEFNLYLPVRAIFRHTSPYVKALEPVQLSEWANLNRPLVREALDILDLQLAQCRYLAGETYTIADITLLFSLQMLGRLEISPAQAGENIDRWYQEVMQRPSVKNAMNEIR